MNRRKIKRKDSNKKHNTKWIMWAGGIASLIAIAVGFSDLLDDIYNVYRKYHPIYAYETEYDWMEMNEATAIFSDQSVVKIYAQPNDNSFDIGVALITLYNNLCEQDRIISNFTVYAEDIVEDYSPVLKYNFDSSDDLVTCTMSNLGWGETGEIHVTLTDISPAYGFEDQTFVDIKLSEGVCTSWIFESLVPGETRDFNFLSLDDFIVNYLEPFEGAVMYRLQFSIDAPENGYHHILDCALEVYPDRVQVFTGGLGGPGEINYVVVVDTSESTYTNTYKTFQRLPANQAIRIPIFIMPTKSCTMSVQIEFQTADGETIKATPLKNAKFIVPYYKDNLEGYIDGQLLDWNKIGDQTKIYFPFQNVSKVIPSEIKNIDKF